MRVYKVALSLSFFFFFFSIFLKFSLVGYKVCLGSLQEARII